MTTTLTDKVSNPTLDASVRNPRSVERLVTGQATSDGDGVKLTRGGVYRDQPHDTQVPYLRQTLGFLGITDLEFIYAEGLAMGPDAETKALASARAEIARVAAGGEAVIA